MNPSQSRLLQMEAELSRDLPGQSELISRVVKSIRKKLAGLGDPKWPLGRFLFLGGIEPAKALAVALAKFMFDDPSATLHIDLANYGEKHTILGLLGHNGGLVAGYIEGALAEPIWRSPRTVVVLENLDKLHPDGLQILAEVMEQGVLLDWVGRSVSFREAIFIMTADFGDKKPSDLGAVFPPEVLRGTFINDVLLWK